MVWAMNSTRRQMMFGMTVLLLAFGIVAAGCSEDRPATAGDSARIVAPSPTPEVQRVGPRPTDWVAQRVASSRECMEADRAAALVWACIEAHGGLAAWLAKSTLAFDFDYQPVAQPEKRMHTHNDVDFWSAHARQQELDGGAGERATLGWNGESAWITPDPSAFPSPARFWALTPYYFVGMPFVAADPGTHYERLPDAELDGTSYQIVKLTYGHGVGDAPDDYYVLYIHPETHLLAALRYVVSFPGFFPEGGHSPEKLMRYSEFTEVDSLKMAQCLDTSAWNVEQGSAGDVVTRIAVSNITLGQTWPADHFAPPPGATVTTEIEARH